MVSLRHSIYVDEYGTRCPNCQIVFRVSSSQLNAAEGAVRCGICLSTFDALANQSEIEQQALPAQTRGIDGDEHVIDDSFDLSLLDENSKTPEADEKTKNLLPHGIGDIELEQLAIDDLDLSVLETDPEEILEEQHLVETSENESLNSAFVKAGATPKAPAADITGDDTSVAMADARPEQAFVSPTDTHTESDGIATAEPVGFNRSTISLSGQLNELIAANQKSPQSKPFRLNRQSTKMFAIVIVGLSSLTFQWFLFNADQDYHQKSYTSVYQRFCGIFSCSDHESRNLPAIQTKNLVVRTHPRRSGSLQVDATLINLAEKPQRFPHMILTFENLEGAILARRNFSPNEYLKGEFVGIDSIPPQQPIHFILEIVDPGEDAVSYTLIPSG